MDVLCLNATQEELAMAMSRLAELLLWFAKAFHWRAGCPVPCNASLMSIYKLS